MVLYVKKLLPGQVITIEEWSTPSMQVSPATFRYPLLIWYVNLQSYGGEYDI